MLRRCEPRENGRHLFATLAVGKNNWTVALFYAYGAAVHVLNILGLSAFDWAAAPLKWRSLDIVYLIVDIIVVAGLFLGWKIGLAVFYLAALSQIVLYTL